MMTMDGQRTEEPPWVGQWWFKVSSMHDAEQGAVDAILR